MLAQKDRVFKTCTVSLETLVPQNNFYRKVENKLDLSFVRELVKDKYCWWNGRPSIDPVVFFKLQLIMFFEGIRSERQLMEMTNMHLDHRWYIGYDLDEKVLDHSSLTQIRDRYGLEVFQSFFEKIVELCIDAGLVWGEELYFDGTKIRANASIDGMVNRWYWEAKQHIEELFPNPDSTEQPAIANRFVDKYDGTRITRRRKTTYKRTTDVRVSPTDPDASLMRRFNGDRAQLGYHTHYIVDGGRSRIILAALTTPASIMDNQPLLDLVRWGRFRWQLNPKIAVGDTKYGTAINIASLEDDGIRAFLPTMNPSRSKNLYSLDRFTYDAKRNIYICPLVGPASGLPNYWLCTGSSIGIAQGAGCGKYLAQWMMYGAAEINMIGLDPRRFGDYATAEYTTAKSHREYQDMYDLLLPGEERMDGRPARTTPIHEKLKAKGGVHTEIMGWERPKWFSLDGREEDYSFRRNNIFEIVAEECKAVCERVGILDLSSFSKYEVSGSDAEDFLNRICANKISRRQNSITLSHALNENGLILNEFTITRLAADRFFLLSGATSQVRDFDILN